ncbi:alpha-1,4-N-acetylglucosaminyltransferase-like [Mantella aurantiaca]
MVQMSHLCRPLDQWSSYSFFLEVHLEVHLEDHPLPYATCTRLADLLLPLFLQLAPVPHSARRDIFLKLRVAQDLGCKEGPPVTSASNTAAGFLYKVTYRDSNIPYFSYIFIGNMGHDTANTITNVNQSDGATTAGTSKEHVHSNKVTAEDILSSGNSIIFLETSERIQLPSLVLCAIESAARVYSNRSVVVFMKGLNHTNSEDQKKGDLGHYPTLSSLDNIHIFPLIMEDIFNNTPLFNWYKKINTTLEKYWIHVSSDGCRLALIWKYGGTYMDTDIISMRPIPHRDFLAGESNQYSSNGIFGFSSQHNFTWKCMENFVQNYNGQSWGNQGPYLFTRVLKTLCILPKFNDTEDVMCDNIPFLNPQRFYPIKYPLWKQYYEVWTKLPTFNESYALHLWNYMNKNRETMLPGSNTLVEHLYQQHCPSTYAALQRNESIYIY